MQLWLIVYTTEIFQIKKKTAAQLICLQSNCFQIKTVEQDIFC